MLRRPSSRASADGRPEGLPTPRPGARRARRRRSGNPPPRCRTPSILNASTTSRTSSAPSMTKLAPISRTTNLGRGSCTSVRKPPSRSPSGDPSGARAGGALWASILAASNAERSSAADMVAKTAPGPHTASSTPVTAGPREPAQALDPPGGGVRRRELLRGPRQRRKEGPLRRPGQRHRGRRQRGQGVDHQLGASTKRAAAVRPMARASIRYPASNTLSRL